MFITFNKQPNQTLHKNNKIIYDDEVIYAEITDKERSVSQFYETTHGWTLIIGNISYRNKNDSNTAKMYGDKYVDSPKKFLEYCEGNFVVIYYDKKKRGLTVFRDALGLKHVYYSISADIFSLSTSLRQLIQAENNLRSNINIQSLNDYLTFQYIPQPNTMFENVYQLPLRGYIIYQDKNLKKLLFEQSITSFFNDHSANGKHNLRVLLKASLERQLPNKSAKIGAFLSGGMDTSSNIAMLASLLNIKPTVFTAAFKEVEYDETPYAKIMADKYNLEHHIITVTSKVIEETNTISSLYDNPVADRAILPEYLICNLAKEIGIEYMVTGEGGDEVLGYPRNLPEDITFPQEVFTDNRKLANLYYSFSGLLPKELRKSLLKNKFTDNNYLKILYDRSGKNHPFEKIYYGQWQTWLIDNVLMKDTQLFNNSNLKFISPYMDIPLMKHVMKLPVEKKMIFLRNKNYLKETLKDILPSEIIYKQKHKFHVPITEWMRGEYYPLFYDTLTKSDGLVDTYLDKRLIIKMLQDHKKGVNDYNRPLWALFFLENWYNTFKQYEYDK